MGALEGSILVINSLFISGAWLATMANLQRIFTVVPIVSGAGLLVTLFRFCMVATILVAMLAKYFFTVLVQFFAVLFYRDHNVAVLGWITDFTTA